MKSGMASYRDKVYEFMENMEEDVCYFIPDFVKEENITIFVECVKDWMDNHAPHGNYNFSDDYKEIKMSEYRGMDFKPRMAIERQYYLCNSRAVGAESTEIEGLAE